MAHFSHISLLVYAQTSAREDSHENANLSVCCNQNLNFQDACTCPVKLTVVQSLCTTAQRDTSSAVSMHPAPDIDLFPANHMHASGTSRSAHWAIYFHPRVLGRWWFVPWPWCHGGTLQLAMHCQVEDYSKVIPAKFMVGRIFFCKGSSGHNGPSGPKANSLVEIILDTVARGIRPDAAVPMRSKVNVSTDFLLSLWLWCGPIAFYCVSMFILNARH